MVRVLTLSYFELRNIVVNVMYIRNDSYLNCGCRKWRMIIAVNFRQYRCDALPTELWSYEVTSAPKCGFISQLVQHGTRIRGGHGFESRWSPDFFRLLLFNCLKWKIYCDDSSSLSKDKLFMDLSAFMYSSSTRDRRIYDSRLHMKSYQLLFKNILWGLLFLKTKNDFSLELGSQKHISKTIQW